MCICPHHACGQPAHSTAQKALSAERKHSNNLHWMANSALLKLV
jgi:hypothetical protein